jgi:hypothetical protein
MLDTMWGASRQKKVPHDIIPRCMIITYSEHASACFLVSLVYLNGRPSLPVLVKQIEILSLTSTSALYQVLSSLIK